MRPIQSLMVKMMEKRLWEISKIWLLYDLFLSICMSFPINHVIFLQSNLSHKDYAMQAARASEEIERLRAGIENLKGEIRVRNETIELMDQQINANKPDEVLGGKYIIYGM